MLLTVLIFIVILAVLVLVHELGHFLVAKWSGIRVDEFGLGFPPRLASWKPRGGETTYSLNAIPFGGFVKIFGENGAEEGVSEDASRSFVAKPAVVQIAVLVAGIAFNLLFAWSLISFGFMIGMPVPTDYLPGAHLSNVQTTITSVDPASPAALAGLKSGDEVVGLSVADTTSAGITISDIQQFTAAHQGQSIIVSYKRGVTLGTAQVIPVFESNINRAAIGVSLDSIGILRLNVFSALWHGATLTTSLVGETATDLVQFLGQLFVGHANLAQVTGPVGIAGLVGQAAALGFVYILSFTAFISINLAIINLIPFPALDGGRVLFVIIEKIKGSPIKSSVSNMVNTVGFVLLILLMLLVTFHDIVGLVH